MIANFEIISFTEVKSDGVEYDLHNNFDFLADRTEISESQIHLYFIKSKGSWADIVKCNSLLFILSNYSFLKQIQPSKELLEDDFCLSGITFFDNDYREEDYGLMDRLFPKENDDIIFTFESERMIRVNCERAELRIE